MSSSGGFKGFSEGVLRRGFPEGAQNALTGEYEPWLCPLAEAVATSLKAPEMLITSGQSQGQTGRNIPI